jgi:hypothetical protein
MKYLIALLLSCSVLFAQNQTNLWQGMSLYQGMPLTTTPSSAGVNSNIWITSFTLGTVRNDLSWTLGCAFRVGATNITISYLGLFNPTNSTQTHRVGLWNAAGTLLGVVTNNLAGWPTNSFSYLALQSPVVLLAGSTNMIGAEEFAGGDLWANSNNTFTKNLGAAGVMGAGFNTGAFAAWTPTTATNTMYVGVNFIYQ